MHASTDDIGVHPRLDHPHFPHCKQRRPIQLVGESRKRRKAGISSVSATAQEPRHRQAGVAGGSETLRTCRIWSCNIRGWTDDLRRWTGLAGGPTVAADFPRGTTSTLSLDSSGGKGWSPPGRNGNRGPRAEGCSLLRSGPISSALLPKTQRRSIRTDSSRIKTGQRPAKTRKRPGRRRVKGPPRQPNRFATGINLWQISGKSASTGSAVAV